MRGLICLAALTAIFGCTPDKRPAVLPEKTLHEAVKLPSQYPPSIFGIAQDEEEYKDLLNPAHDNLYFFSQHFGVTYKRHYSRIYRGLKPLRIALLSQGDKYIFEVQMDGDAEIAKKCYGKRMQILITFAHPPRTLGDYRIVTTDTLDKALLLSGDTAGLDILVNDDGKAVSAKLDSKFKVEKELSLEFKGDKVRFYMPVESIPKQAQKYWSAEKADFEWDVRIGLALEPLNPIPTNLTNVFFMPEVYHIWYPKDRPAWDKTFKWSAEKAPVPPAGDEKKNTTKD